MSFHYPPAHPHYYHAVERSAASGVDYPRYLADVSVMLIRSLKFDCKATASQVAQHMGPHYHDRLLEYVSNLFRQTRISYSIVIVGLLYLLRFQQQFKRRLANAAAVFRAEDNAFVLFVAAMMLSSKFLMDRPPANSCWSLNARVPLSIVNRQELLFLNVIGHEMYVESEYFQNWIRYLFHPRHTTPYQVHVLPFYLPPQHSEQQPKRKRVSLKTINHQNRHLYALQLQQQQQQQNIFHGHFPYHQTYAPFSARIE